MNDNMGAGENAAGCGLYFRDDRAHSWRWQPILEKWGHLRVFINPDCLKTATFLVEDGDPISTMFFVRMPLGNPRAPEGYDYFAVTTQHSVKDTQVSIRLNLKGKDKGVHDEPTSQHDWIHHPKTDLSILPIRFPLDEYKVNFVEPHEMTQGKRFIYTDPPTTDEATEEKKSLLRRYGEGDEVFTVGLFSGHSGSKVAQPAARFGHIALVPADGEKITACMGGEVYAPIEAFLIELAAAGGQSGSPVFIRSWVGEDRNTARRAWRLNFLIGMIQGFYPTDESVRIGGRDVQATIPSGIGIVIPSRIIRDMLMEDSLVKERRRKLEQIREERSAAQVKPLPASVRKPLDSGNTGITREGFEEALRRSSRKISPPDEGTKET